MTWAKRENVQVSNGEVANCGGKDCEHSGFEAWRGRSVKSLAMVKCRLRREGLPAFWFRDMASVKREIVGNGEVVDGEEKSA